MQTKKVRDNTRTFLSAQHELHKNTFAAIDSVLAITLFIKARVECIEILFVQLICRQP